jgi:hypothetical protein
MYFVPITKTIGGTVDTTTAAPQPDVTHPCDRRAVIGIVYTNTVHTTTLNEASANGSCSSRRAALRRFVAVPMFEIAPCPRDQLEMPTALRFGDQSVECQENCETCQLH